MSSRWISEWNPEDPVFWERTGSSIARRNLVWSILAENIGFSVWLLWSVVVPRLKSAGFHTVVHSIPSVYSCWPDVGESKTEREALSLAQRPLPTHCRHPKGPLAEPRRPAPHDPPRDCGPTVTFMTARNGLK